MPITVPVIDDHRLVPAFGDFLRTEARHQIESAAGPDADNDSDRALRVTGGFVLREGDQRQE